MNARLKRAIKESIFEFEKERKVNFSQGYATYPDDANNAKDLLKKAHIAMVSESQERLKKNIMIVDDEPVVIDALERLLRELGYSNFIKAYDGDEALAKIKNLTPDLVILDMKIPKMDGYMVVGKLKEDSNTKDVPILIMSGYKIETGRLKNHTTKENIPVIEKPISIEQLDRMVYYLL
jgi:CheY-like chemotaxis protein